MPDDGQDVPSDVLTADINGDGHMDIVTASSRDNTVRWYENDGFGGLTAHTVATAKFQVDDVSVVDIDGDGLLDIASLGWNTALYWHEQQRDASGNVSFVEHYGHRHTRSQGLFGADFDNDGNMDVVAGIYNAAEIRWYENNKEALNMQRVLPQSIALHPNPMTNVLHISYISTTTVNYTLYDSTGKQLSSQIHTGKEHQLEVSHLASGTYLLKANNDTQFKYYRFMKE